MTKYFNVYGARYNKDKTRVNITLINSQGEDAEWATISLKVDDKEKIIVKEGGVYLAVKFLKDLGKKTKSKKDNKDDDEGETLPF